MFTGIINHLSVIDAVRTTPKSLQIWVENSYDDLQLGESVAVDGICLTVGEIRNNCFRCDISPETLQLTTAKNFQLKKKVNLERALRPIDRMGGHFVSGHVDQIVAVKSKQTLVDFTAVEFSGIASEAKKFLVKKGSVAINGVSLTINALSGDGFQVMLIPHTLQHTNLSALNVGDTVNVEYDLLAKLVGIQQT